MIFLHILFLLLASYGEASVTANHEYAKIIEGKSVCENLLKITYFDFHKYNRTAKALSVNFTLFVDVTTQNDIEIKNSFYVWKNNDYKKTLINWDMKICNFLAKDSFNIQYLLKDSTTKLCPLKKGNHYIKNISPPNFEGWPSVIPEGKWKLLIRYYLQNTYCFSVEWISTITKN